MVFHNTRQKCNIKQQTM